MTVRSALPHRADGKLMTMRCRSSGSSGGLATGALFQYPGLIMMSLVGVGAANFLVDPPAWFKGAVDGMRLIAANTICIIHLGNDSIQCSLLL